MNYNLVCYLFTKFDELNSIKEFIKHYKKHHSGSKHTLLICYKLLDKKKIIYLRKMLTNINYTEFIDPVSFNDYDFGSYKRVSKKYRSYKILFLNSHSYPLSNNWLKKLLFHYKKNTILGTSASNESFLTSLKLKKFYKIISFLKKYKRYKKNFFPFPNPHIRTSSFLIRGSDFLTFTKNKIFLTKEDTWMAESGINGLTNFFIKKKFNIYVINSDGEKFSKKNWMFSRTFCYLSKSKSLISDKHVRKYFRLLKVDRLKSQHNVWGE